MKRAVAALALSFCLLVGVLVWRMGPPPAGIVAEFDARAGAAPVVVMLGGSEGGRYAAEHPLAEAFGNAGFHVARVAYFGAPGTPAKLDRIALEPLDDYLADLGARGDVLGRCTYVMGASKGAELALLLAAGNPRLGAVAAVVPSHVVFQSLRLTPLRHSAWRRGGQSLAFVPYPRDLSMVRGIIGRDSYLEMHSRALENTEAVARATIPVERIAGPVLLIGATRDQVWPSAYMAGQLADRLTESGFPHEVAVHEVDHDHYVLGREDVRDRIVTFLTRAAQQGGCLPRPAQ